MTHVVVIGAGVIGTATALRLAQGGARVTLLDAGRPGGGTSTRSFAWLNAHNKQPHAYYALNVSGMQAHAALAEELGDNTWRHGGGCLEWTDAAGRDTQRARAERLAAWGYQVEWLTAQAARRMEPDLDPAVLADAPVAFFPSEGWMDTARYLAVLLARIAALGGALRTGTRVTGLMTAGGRCAGVATAEGTIGADIVVNCAGPDINAITPDAALHVPMASTRGLLAVTAPAPVTLGRVLQGPGSLALRPDGGGRVMIHAKDADELLPPDGGAGAAPRLADRAAALLAPLRGVPAEAARLATRPIPEDGHPAIGPIGGLSGYYLAVTHSGVTLATLLGGLIAGEILNGREAAALAPFRLDRFSQTKRPRGRMDGLR